MIRPSSLSIAEKCALSPVLSARFPETNPNIERGLYVEQQVYKELSTGANATDPDAAACVRWLRANLDIREYQQKVELRDETGRLVTEGTPDIVGTDTWQPGLLLVVDLKKREQVTYGKIPDVDDNLQLHAYAIAHAQRDGFLTYRTCLLTFGEGTAEPLWSHAYGPPEWGPILERIKRISGQSGNISGKDPPGQAGPHCTNCYPRVHCPHWAIPAHQGPSYLAPFVEPGGLSVETAGKGLLAVRAMRDMCDRAEQALKAFRLANGPGSIVVGDQSWEPVQQQGRRTADLAALERDGLSGYIRKGEPFETWRLVRIRKQGG